jgi:hypothetical protein
MCLNRVTLSFFIGVIVISSIFFSGCITDLSVNSSQQQAPLTTIPIQTLQIPATPSVISITTLDTPFFSQTSTPVPIFTETGPPMVDTNGTRILSKAQAWSYAEVYLETRGLTNIQPVEVTAHDPNFFTHSDKKRELVWTFDINKKDSMGFERGGIIAINAYDGNVVWYASIT